MACRGHRLVHFAQAPRTSKILGEVARPTHVAFRRLDRENKMKTVNTICFLSLALLGAVTVAAAVAMSATTDTDWLEGIDLGLMSPHDRNFLEDRLVGVIQEGLTGINMKFLFYIRSKGESSRNSASVRPPRTLDFMLKEAVLA
jgi:hypothetical protein